MPKTSAHHHLYLNHQTWMFRFRWPKDVIKGVEGQTEFHKSLKTSVLQEAISERDVLLAHCKKIVKKLRAGNMLSIERIIDNDIRDYFEVMPEDWVKFSPKFKNNLAKHYWRIMTDDQS